MNWKKGIAVALSAITVMAMVAGCGSNTTTSDQKKIGVIQLVEHPSLDAANKGFVDGLASKGFKDGENIKIDQQNAQADQSNLNSIAQRFVSDKKDLVLAIATPAAQTMANASHDIPIMGTAITDYVTAKLVQSNEHPGGNVTGTSDMTPVKEQIDLLKKLIPDAKTVGVLYCSAESNSVLQADMAKEACKAAGLEAADYTVSSSNEIQTVVESMIGKVDVIYAPTDNMIAAGMATVAMIANENKIPIICGEEGMVKEGRLATYGINYYKLGYKTGEMAAKILTEGADPASMPIEYLSTEECSLLINKETADTLGIDVSSYDADSLYTEE